MTDLATLEAQIVGAIGTATDLASLDAVRVSALGKTGSISGLLKGMGALSPDERREQGCESVKDACHGSILLVGVDAMVKG